MSNLDRQIEKRASLEVGYTIPPLHTSPFDKLQLGSSRRDRGCLLECARCFEFKHLWRSPENTKFAVYGEEWTPGVGLPDLEDAAIYIIDRHGMKLARVERGGFAGFINEQQYARPDGSVATIGSSEDALTLSPLQRPPGDWSYHLPLKDDGSAWLLRSEESYCVLSDGRLSVPINSGRLVEETYDYRMAVMLGGDLVITGKGTGEIDVLHKSAQGWKKFGFQLESAGELHMLCGAHDGTRAFAGTDSGRIVQFDPVNRGHERTLFLVEVPEQDCGRYIPICAMACSRDGEILAVGTGDGRVLTYNVASGQMLREISLGGKVSHGSVGGGKDIERFVTREERAAYFLCFSQNDDRVLATTNFAELLSLAVR